MGKIHEYAIAKEDKNYKYNIRCYHSIKEDIMIGGEMGETGGPISSLIGL